MKLFSLFGFEVSVDASWLLLAVLSTWSLAGAVFPYLAPGLPTASYWVMAAIATVGLLLSIVFHETAHSLVARHYGMPIRGITLFIFGGVAEMTAEPNRPRDEFLMAAAGPAASLLLAATLFLLFTGVVTSSGPAPVAGVLWYLALLNFVLALFNLVPAFPLDGGRIFRAALWSWRGDLDWATRIAAGAGNAFGILLIVLGLIGVLQGDFIGGMWRFLIGMFLRGAASASYGETLARRLLADIPTARIMNSNPIAVAQDLSVQDFIDEKVCRLSVHRHTPGIADRTYPPSLAGPHYPAGIPIVSEDRLDDLCRAEHVDQVVLAYSDVLHMHVMHLASRALATGADFLLLGPQRTMLAASRPLTAAPAV